MSINFEFAYNKIPKNDGGRDKPTALADWWDFWKEIHSVIESFDDSMVQVVKSAMHYLYPPFGLMETFFLIQQAYKSIEIAIPVDCFSEIFDLMQEQVKIRISIQFKT